MKKKDLNAIKSKSTKELETMAAELRAQIMRAKMEISMRKSKNTNTAKNFKRTLSQVLTIKRAKELAGKEK